MTKVANIIIPDGANPEDHELKTAKFFTKRGKTIEFLPRRYDKGIKTPDAKMDNILWEIKAPQSDGKHTIEHAFRKALKQSANIIFDLRRSKMLDSKCISQLTKHFNDMKKIKRLLIITKSQKLLDFEK
jgi:hypothetical protein